MAWLLYIGEMYVQGHGVYVISDVRIGENLSYLLASLEGHYYNSLFNLEVYL